MNTLVTGNIGYWSEKTLRRAFGDETIVVSGKDLVLEKKSGILSYPVSICDEQFEEIFHNYIFDRVVYISDYLTLHGSPDSEMENLRRLMRLCKAESTAQIVFLSSIEICSDAETGKKLILQSEEQLCNYYAAMHWLTIKTIRVPFLYSETNKNGYFYHLFEKMEQGKKIRILDDAGQKTCFIDMEDLAEFLYRLFDSWDGETETLNLQSFRNHTFEELGTWISKKHPEIQISYEAECPPYQLDWGENRVRSLYGWFARHDIMDSLDEVYGKYDHIVHKKLPLWKKIREKVMNSPRWLMAAELAGGCVLTEWLTSLLSSTVQFASIDIRLLFIVLMGNVYGLNAGVSAAFLATIAVCYSYAAKGMNWQILFYEPANWIPFILYFTAGSVCGYVKYRSDDMLLFLRKEKELILEKYLFINSLYQESLENKREYKKQIIGSKDSFGKIFEIVRQLDKIVPQEIFARAIPVMEDVLDNKDIAIYSIQNSHALFARLEVSSHSMEKSLKKSIRLEQYEEALETLKKGEIWINTQLLPEYPMYIAGVKNQDEIILLIMIYRTRYDQMGMYYANLFRIICGLIQNSFLSAWQYQAAVRNTVYIDNTMITREFYFMEQLKLRHEMAENGISSYALVQILAAGKTDQELDELLRNKVRDTDLLGRASDKNLYLLLSQADNDSVTIVLNRLASSSLNCTQVSNINVDEMEG